jgi:glycine/D-amino acid oxidase-like deaminating enzyme
MVTARAALPRVADIGAGIVGAAIAYRLAGRGVQVVVLDRQDPAAGTTAASFALVRARIADERAAFDLCVAAMQECHRLAWGLAPAPWYHADGCLVWPRDADRAAALAETVQRLHDWGYAAETLPAADAPSLLAAELVGSDPDVTVAWFAGEAWVEAPAMTRRLLEAVRNAGGRILAGPDRAVVAIGLHDGRVTEVTLHGGQTIPVVAVVNAAGPDAGRVAALAGRRLVMAEERGLVLRTALPSAGGAPHRPLETDEVHLRPDGDAALLLTSPAIDTSLGDVPPGPYPIDDPLTIALHARGADVFPALADATRLDARVGAGTRPAGRLASVGAVPDIPGYWEAVAAPGITLAPLIGRSLAGEILGREGNPLLAPFRP